MRMTDSYLEPKHPIRYWFKKQLCKLRKGHRWTETLRIQLVCGEIKVGKEMTFAACHDCLWLHWDNKGENKNGIYWPNRDQEVTLIKRSCQCKS